MLNPANDGGGTPTNENNTQIAREAAGPNTQTHAMGFFASLFDFGFTSFITLQLLRVIYGFVVVLVVLASVFVIGAGVYRGGASLFAIVVVPIVALIYLVLPRVSMEMIALFFRIGQNTNLWSPHPAERALTAGRSTSLGSDQHHQIRDEGTFGGVCTWGRGSRSRRSCPQRRQELRKFNEHA